MAIPNRPIIAERAYWDTIQPVQATITPLTSSITNTATSATLATGLTLTCPKMGSLVKYVKVILSAEYLTNSAAVDVTVALWLGTVGTGTQLAATVVSVPTGGNKFPALFEWLIPVSSSYIAQGSTPTLNIDLHGSGAGTNTLAAASTSPIFFSAEYL